MPNLGQPEATHRQARAEGGRSADRVSGSVYRSGGDGGSTGTPAPVARDRQRASIIDSIGLDVIPRVHPALQDALSLGHTTAALIGNHRPPQIGRH
jgi:hypothetical protein